MSSIRDVLAAQIPRKQEEMKKLKKDYGHLSLGEVTVDQAIGGGRDVKCMYYETSLLDAQEVCTTANLLFLTNKIIINPYRTSNRAFASEDTAFLNFSRSLLLLRAQLVKASRFQRLSFGCSLHLSFQLWSRQDQLLLN